MKYFKILGMVAVLLLFGACASIDYLGKKYPPTTNVDVFLDSKEIAKEYELMGESLVKSTFGKSSEKMLEKAIEKAKEVGADAILVGELEEVSTGSSTKENTDFNKTDHGNRATTTITTTENTQLRFKVLFLKYK